MDLNGIEIFVKVVQAGSFNRAAKALGMPNSTASAKVSQLEHRLGVTLLQRTTRKLSLTEAGKNYFDHCLHALDDLKAAESELATSRSEPQGVLRLTAPVEVGHTILPGLVCAYLEAHPAMNVDVVVTNRVLDLVAEGIDLAIRAGQLKDSSLVARRFALGRFALWASPAYLRDHPAPAHPKDLSRHRFLQFSLFKRRPLGLTNGNLHVKVSVSGRFFADDFEVLRSSAVLGEGVVFLPSFLCEEQRRQNKLIRILPDWHGDAVTLSFVHPAQRFVPPKVRAFITAAGNIFRDKG